MPSPKTYGFSGSVSEPATAWHTLEIEETLALLSSDRNAGLTSQEAIERLQRYGANEIQEAGGRRSLSILLDQFTNIILMAWDYNYAQNSVTQTDGRRWYSRPCA